jgi:hypothetical protein
MRRQTAPIVLCLVCSLAMAAPASRAAQGDAPSFDAIQRRVEEIRGLRFKSPVSRAELTAEALRAELHKEMDQEYKPSDWMPIESTLKAFRLIPSSMNLKQQMTKLLDQQVAGLYDPRSKRLYVLKGSPATESGELGGMEDVLGGYGVDIAGISMSHELTHALDDQNFDLLSLPVEERFDQDRAGAAMALVEGDATWVMMQYMWVSLGFEGDASESLGQLGDLSGLVQNAGASMGEDVPRYIQENLLGAYLSGMAFVKAVRARGGSTAVDALFRKPPQSVEQILHPEKFFAGEVPARLSAKLPASWASAGFKEYTSGVWGEMNARIILQELNVPKEVAVQASEGWGGDAYVTARGPAGGLSWIWVTRWDTEKDAREFRDAASKSPSLKVVLEGRQVTVTFGGPAGKK